MVDRRIGLLLRSTAERTAVQLGVDAERMGYESVWSGELWGEDAFVRLTAIAERTDDLALGTSIVNVFGRSPATLAMAAATLDELANGRFTLGLGVSTKKAVTDLHGEAFERPVRRTHEVIELVKRFTSDAGRVQYDGEVFDVADFAGLDRPVPVYNAALGRANRRATGRLADGWIPHNIPLSALDEAFETIATAARERDRDPAEITVAPFVPTAVSEDPREARRALKGHIAYYVGSGAGYENAVAGSFPDEAPAIASAWQAGQLEEAAERVTDEMVAAIGVAGTPADARQRYREILAETIVDRPIVMVPKQAKEQLMAQTAAALAPEAF